MWNLAGKHYKALCLLHRNNVAPDDSSRRILVADGMINHDLSVTFRGERCVRTWPISNREKYLVDGTGNKAYKTGRPGASPGISGRNNQMTTRNCKGTAPVRCKDGEHYIVFLKGTLIPFPWEVRRKIPAAERTDPARGIDIINAYKTEEHARMAAACYNIEAEV